MTADRYIVRVGDDGRAKSRHADLPAARAAARTLVETGWAGKAQILDTLEGGRERWGFNDYGDVRPMGAML
jgi:hypothetical protein